MKRRYIPAYDRRVVVHDAELGYMLRICDIGQIQAPEFTHSWSTNRWGFREFFIRTPERLILGDSFAWGFGVEFWDAIPRLLSAAYIGECGWGTCQLVLAYQRYAPLMLQKPLPTYLFFNDTDIDENAGQGISPRIAGCFFEKVAKRRFDLWLNYVNNPDSAYHKWLWKLYFYGLEGGYSFFEMATEQILALARRQLPQDTTLVYLPLISHFEGKKPRGRWVLDYWKGPTLDLTPAMDHSMYYPIDCHLRRKGCKAVAEEILKYEERNRRLREPG